VYADTELVTTERSDEPIKRINRGVRRDIVESEDGKPDDVELDEDSQSTGGVIRAPIMVPQDLLGIQPLRRKLLRTPQRGNYSCPKMMICVVLGPERAISKILSYNRRSDAAERR
jgi:hypothetical protein